MKKLFLTTLIFIGLSINCIAQNNGPETVSKEVTEQGNIYLKEILSQPWSNNWRGSELKSIRKVDSIWYAKIIGKQALSGYMMWSMNKKIGLLEFSLDGPLKKIATATAKAIDGIPNVQQFTLPSAEYGKVASGCAPTAGSSMIGYWINKGYKAWQTDSLKSLNGIELYQALTRVLRSKMPMMTIPDTKGYADGAMALSGTYPDELVKSLKQFATETKANFTINQTLFSFEAFQKEINAAFPVLISCFVRLPHKPELNWGHEVVGVGWANIANNKFVGVIDNFYPVQQAETIRWIAAKDCSLSITVRPN